MVLDGGDALFSDATLAHRPDAELLRDRARLIARSTVHRGLDAANVGRRDLAAGLEFAAGLGTDPGVPWVSANLMRSDGSFPFPRWRTLERGGVRLLVTGVVIPDPRQDPPLGLAPLPPVEALLEVLRQALAEAPADLVVVLSTLGLPAERRLAQAVPGIQIIVGGGDRQQWVDPVVEGDTAIFHAADRGRFVGVLRLDPATLTTWRAPRTPHMRQALEDQRAALALTLARTTDPAQRQALQAQQLDLAARAARIAPPGTELAHRLVPLGPTIDDDPEVAGWVARWKQSAARQRPPVAGPPAGAPRGPRPAPAAGKPSGTYTGTGSCRPCHAAAYVAWSATPHARSYAALRGQPRAEQCLECHASRLPRAGGTSLEPIVGCEACHGPGAGHQGPGGIARSPGEDTCRRCHRGHHPDEAFVFGEDYEKVRCDRAVSRKP
ncbi:MAG: multiheme c-type cytochrome [Deferrisomatales bacterium]|nr:multiheme c-type cytochrome [Deferrisomatales bacterium]